MASVEIGGELDFVNGHKWQIEIARHRLDSRNPVMRRLRLDFLFASDECDRARTCLLHGAVVDLAGKQPERQAYHSAGIAKHPLKGVMRLSRIGWTEQQCYGLCPVHGE